MGYGLMGGLPPVQMHGHARKRPVTNSRRMDASPPQFKSISIDCSQLNRSRLLACQFHASH